MPMNPAVQAVIKAITRLQPDVADRNSHSRARRRQAHLCDLRCRIDDHRQGRRDDEIPLRGFTPLDTM